MALASPLLPHLLNGGMEHISQTFFVTSIKEMCRTIRLTTIQRALVSTLKTHLKPARATRWN